MLFYPGITHPEHAANLRRCMISVNALRRRKSPFKAHEWIMDSGAFTEIHRFGEYRWQPTTVRKK